MSASRQKRPVDAHRAPSGRSVMVIVVRRMLIDTESRMLLAFLGYNFAWRLRRLLGDLEATTLHEMLKKYR
jgi:hypothetical protein